MNYNETVSVSQVLNCIIRLHSPNFDDSLFLDGKIPINALNELRIQCGYKDLKTALERYVEEIICNYIPEKSYRKICDFLMENGYETSLKFIPDEALRMEYLKEVKNQGKQAKILASFSSDSLKLELLKGFKNEKDRVEVICSLESDDLKLKLLENVKDYHKVAYIIASLNDDSKKVEFLYSGKVHHSMTSVVISSLKEDDKKEALLHLAPSDFGKLRIILSMENHDIKMDLYEKEIESDSVKRSGYSSLILSLPVSEQLQHFHELGDDNRYKVLMNCTYDIKLQLLPEINDEVLKTRILASMTDEQIGAYLIEKFSDNQNYWVRTDSKEKEIDAPRDDRERILSDVVKYSRLSINSKITLIKKYAKDEEKIKNLLSGFQFDDVLNYYFDINEEYINIEDLEHINKVYPLSDVYDLIIKTDSNFDFTSSDGKRVFEILETLDNPLLLFERMNVNDYKRWHEFLANSNVIMNVTNLEMHGEEKNQSEVLKYINDVAYFVIDDRYIAPRRYAILLYETGKCLEGENCSNLDTLKSRIALGLGIDSIGAALKETDYFLGMQNYDDETTQRIGEKVVSFLYKFYETDEKNKFRLGFDRKAVEVVDKFDKSEKILTDYLPSMVKDMPKDGIRAAIEINLEKGKISRPFAIRFLLKYAGNHVHDEKGIDYGLPVIEELLDSQSMKVNQIEALTSGGFSDVYKVGNFVMKIGENRRTPEVPEHPRILPSLLRFEVDSYDTSSDVVSFIEVQPYLHPMEELEWSSDEQEVRLYEVFNDLRTSGIFWGDAAKRNIGFCDNESNTPCEMFSSFKQRLEEEAGVTIHHSDKTSMLPQSNQGNSPYLIVFDTDFLYTLDRYSNEVGSLAMPSPQSESFEIEYEAENNILTFKNFRNMPIGNSKKAHVKQMSKDVNRRENSKKKISKDADSIGE